MPDNVPYQSVQGSPLQIYLVNGDFPKGEAGPSGVNHNTTQLPTLAHANAAGTDGDYGLSKLQCSHHITDYVDWVGQQWWGSNHLWYFIVDEEEEEEEEEEELSNKEDYSDSFEQDDEYVMLGAEPGQEGVSVWDLLGEGFLKEALKLGLSLYYYCTVHAG